MNCCFQYIAFFIIGLFAIIGPVSAFQQQECSLQLENKFGFGLNISPEIEQLINGLLTDGDRCQQFLAYISEQLSEYVDWNEWPKLDTSYRRSVASKLITLLHFKSKSKSANKSMDDPHSPLNILRSNVFDNNLFDHSGPDNKNMTCVQRLQHNLQLFDEFVPNIANHLNKLNQSACWQLVNQFKRNLFKYSQMRYSDWITFTVPFKRKLVEYLFGLMHINTAVKPAASSVDNQTNLATDLDAVYSSDIFIGKIFATEHNQSVPNRTVLEKGIQLDHIDTNHDKLNASTINGTTLNETYFFRDHLRHRHGSSSSLSKTSHTSHVIAISLVSFAFARMLLH